MKQKRVCRYNRIALISFFCLLGSVFCAQAQYESMKAADLLGEADLLLKTERYDEAVPYLASYLSRFGDNNDFRIVLMAQDVRFKLGKIMAKSKNATETASYLEQYVRRRPAPKWHEAMKLLSLSLLESAQYEKCAEMTVEALAGPTNEINPVVSTPVVDEEGDKPKFKTDEFGNIIEDTGVQSAAEELDPSGYTQADMVILNTTLGEAYEALGKVEESISPFLYVAEHETIAIRRGYAIMKAIEAMVELQKFDELTRLIPPLYQTDARYDIRVNLAIMSAASSLFDAEKYDEALPMYRMILPRGKLIEFQTKRIKRLQFDAGIITLADLTKHEAIELGIDYTLMGQKTKVVTEEFWHERGDSGIEKPQELIDLEALIDTLVGLPPYEQDVMFRNAYLYDAVDRPWEAVELFNGLWEENPDTDIAQRSFYEAIRVLFEKLGGGAEIEQRCYEYLDQYKKDLTPRQIAYLLTGYYQRTEQLPSIKKLLPYLDGFLPSALPAVRPYEVELYYMQAIADLVMLEYEKAKASFELVLTRFPHSHQEENVSYWHAMTLMFLQKYDEAYPEFEAYLEKFPKGEWVASANFQLGTCLFGMERFDEAKARFTVVVDQYPDSPAYPDACSMRGDILGSEGLLDEAVADYKNAIASANAVVEESPERAKKQATYATFQMAAVFEAEERYEELIAAVTDYLNFYGADANISKGIFWIGKTRINQGRVDEAVQSYLNAIVQYGTDLKQDGVDSMIAELVEVARRRLTVPDRAKMNSAVEQALQETDDLTLQLRLRALIAQLNGTEVELGKTLITELADLSVASPPVLAAISKASFDLEDYSRAAEILNVFQTQFDESEFIRPAYKLSAFGLRSAGDLDGAMKSIGDAQARYGAEADVAWAQLMKGEILLQKGQYDEARKELLAVLNVTEWRGAPFAEATYRLGQVDEAAGDPRKAFGWYQRAYFQYKGYANGYWAAEAYLASARCLNKMGLRTEEHNTYRAMLFDKHVNSLPQASVAREALGAKEVQDIFGLIAAGTKTNITVTLDVEVGE